MELCLAWFDRHKELVVAAYAQLYEPSNFGWARPADSQLDFERWLAEGFNWLRVVDNKHYPLFFRMSGRTFLIRVLGENDDAQKQQLGPEPLNCTH